MTKHIIRRLLQAIPTLFGVTIISYFLMWIAPGNPVKLMTFDNPKMTIEERDRIAERFGLLDPWYVQYITWLTGNDWQWWHNSNSDGSDQPVVQRPVRYGILRGDFGTSIKKRLPVINIILDRMPATAELGVASLLVALTIGIPIGIFAAVWRGSLFDQFSRILSVIGNAVPSFWLGLILILIFGTTLNISWARGDRCSVSSRTYRDPQTGRTIRRTCSEVPIYERLGFMVFPTILLAYGGVAGYSRYMRTSMLDTISSDYIRTAHAKGLSSQTVWFKHAARNALIPIATFLGPAFVGVLSGAVIIETIYNWPGLGRLYIEAVTARDYPIVMALVLIGAFLTVIAYVISDILYALFDPRIRY